MFFDSTRPSGLFLRNVAVPLVLVAAAAAFRLAPHPPNFAPIGALALFAGAAFPSWRWALLAPLAAMLISDAWLGFHPYMPAVYGCMLVNVGLGCWVRSRNVMGAADGAAEGAPTQAAPGRRGVRQAAYVSGATLCGSVFFFLATNFAVWLGVYERTWSGLAACYTAALPFFRYTLAGDLVFATGLFVAYAFSLRWLPAPKSAAAH